MQRVTGLSVAYSKSYSRHFCQKSAFPMCVLKHNPFAARDFVLLKKKSRRGIQPSPNVHSVQLWFSWVCTRRRSSSDVLPADTKHVIKDVIWCHKSSERVKRVINGERKGFHHICYELLFNNHWAANVISWLAVVHVSVKTWADSFGITQWLAQWLGDSSVVRAPYLWFKGRGFESLQERWENFPLQDDFLCWLLFRYPFHSRVTAVARKRTRSFCQKCGWQVTAKHAYTLRMWLCMNWHGAWLYGVHWTSYETAAVSCETSRASAVSTPLRWIFKKQNKTETAIKS